MSEVSRDPRWSSGTGSPHPAGRLTAGSSSPQPAESSGTVSLQVPAGATLGQELPCFCGCSLPPTAGPDPKQRPLMTGTRPRTAGPEEESRCGEALSPACRASSLCLHGPSARVSFARGWLWVTPLRALRVGRAGGQRRPAHLAPRDTAGLLSPGLPAHAVPARRAGRSPPAPSARSQNRSLMSSADGLSYCFPDGRFRIAENTTKKGY